jgi:hypothetical protein
MQQMLCSRRRDKRRVECYIMREVLATAVLGIARPGQYGRLQHRRKKPRTPGEQLAQVGGRAGHQPTACGGCRSLPKVWPSTHSGRKGPVGEWVNWRAGCPSVHWPLADDPTQYPIGTTLEGRQIDGRSSRRFRPFFENRSSPAKWFTIPSQSSPS